MKADLAVSLQLLNRTSIKALAVSLQTPGTGTPSSGRQSPNDLERKYAARMICGRSQRARFGPTRQWLQAIRLRLQSCAATHGRGGDALLAEPDDHVPVYSVQAFAAHRPACVRVVDVRINLCVLKSFW